MGKRKHTQESIEEIFKEQGCEVVSQFITSDKPIDYICKCGNTSRTYLYNFENGVRCRKCGSKRNSENRKLSIKELETLFNEGDCELLSKKKASSKELLSYRCSCGNVSKISYDNFKKGVRCKECGLGKLAESFRHDYEYIKERFEENSCELLTTEYRNSKQLLEYICSCGEKTTTMYVNFMKGKRCKDCGIKKNSGENHPNYNPDLTDKDRKRRIPGFEKWRQDVFERDLYTCKKCEQFLVKELNAHHIYNYASHKDRILDVSNGATLCKNCHIEFHKKYGYYNNNRDQLREWLNADVDGDKSA